MGKLITIKEATEILNISQQTVRRWINNGTLKAFKYGKRNIRLCKNEILEITQKGTGEVKPRPAKRYISKSKPRTMTPKGKTKRRSLPWEN